MPAQNQSVHSAQREHICFVESALEILGSKWTILLIHEMMNGPKRFTELRKAIPEASAKILTLRLRELEDAHILTRRCFAETPPHVEYTLTESGLALKNVIEQLRYWGEEFSHTHS